MSVLETIVEELKGLPSAKLEEAASYVHQLKTAALEERRTILDSLAGSLSEEDANAFDEAIKECRRIDPREW
jgi:hypothetical protein